MKLARNVFASVVAAIVAVGVFAPGGAYAIEATESRDAVVTQGVVASEEMGVEDGSGMGAADEIGQEADMQPTQTPAQQTPQQPTQTPAQPTPQTTTAQQVQQQTPTQQAVAVYDAEGLLAMANDPYGSYQLMCDVDLAGITWQPIEFHGTLDGNGYAILNASVSNAGQARRSTYDGNMKEYSTAFAGFFDTLENAVVRNVALLGLRVDVNNSEPTFVGGLVGYMDDATIEGCTVVGQVSLATTGASFGVGGIAGFGRGRIAGSTADVTLVCRDLDVYEKDEQFMGGAYGVGYADLTDNSVILRGYDSDHGYVHNGGLVGMYIVYDETADHAGTVANNSVKGFITFFEDNEDRRAYCEPEIGENMSMEAITTREGNSSDFTPDERFEYDQDLLPHTCENPQWSEEVVAGSCEYHGFTKRVCSTCGYSERVAWTPLVHEVAEWTTTGEADASGLVVQQGTCTRCGATVYERVTAAEAADAASVEGENSAAQAATDVTAAQASSEAGGFPLPVVILVSVLVIACIAALVIVLRRRA